MKSRTPPFFEQQLRLIVRAARARGNGLSVRAAAATASGDVRSTLKQLEAGLHISPTMLKAAAGLYAVRPVDWIEVKVRYVEAHMEGYLVAPEKTHRASLVDAGKFAAFMKLRAANLRKYGMGADYLRERLGLRARDAFRMAGITLAAVCTATGKKNSKKDKFTVKLDTVRLFRAGGGIRPEKFGFIARRLKLPAPQDRFLRIAYAEKVLDEHLLGDGTVSFSGLNDTDHPRTVSLLIFSTQHPAELA